MSRRDFLSLWIPPALYLLLIFILSSMSHPPVPYWVNGDLLHYPEYAFLGFLLARAMQGSEQGLPSIWVLVGAFLLSVFFGATDEIHQAFVPNRIPDLNDWWHDGVGAGVGALGWGAWRWMAR